MFKPGDRVIANNKTGLIKSEDDTKAIKEYGQVRVWWEKPQLPKCQVFQIEKVQLATEENLAILETELKKEADKLAALPTFKPGDKVVRKNRKNQVGVVVAVGKAKVRVRWEKSFVHFSAGAIDTHSVIKKSSLIKIQPERT